MTCTNSAPPASVSGRSYPRVTSPVPCHVTWQRPDDRTLIVECLGCGWKPWIEPHHDDAHLERLALMHETGEAA